MITVQSFLFQSIPEAIVYSAFTIALAGLVIRRNLLKIVFSGFVIACITVVLWYVELPFYARFMLQLPLLWIVYYFIFRYPYYRVMITATVGIGILMIAETISTELVILMTNITFEQIIASNLLRILVPGGGYVVLVVATWLISRSSWSIFGRRSSAGREEYAVNKKVDIYILALTMQILLVVVYNLSYVNGFFQQSHLLFQMMIFSVIILSFILLFYVQYIVALSEKAGELEAQKAYIKHVDDLFVTIRGQRHDFLNHVQVLHSFAILERYDLLREYINTLTDEVKEIGKIIVPGNATLSALLQTKSVLFKTYDIELNVTINDDLNKTKVETIDQVKLVGNLLDNAKEVIEQYNVEKDKRNIAITVNRIDDMIELMVKNDRPILTEEQIQQMFIIGFTSKANHTGIGLGIVKQIIDKYQGQLVVNSSEQDGTVFSIKFPMLKDGNNSENTSASFSNTNCEQFQQASIS